MSNAFKINRFFDYKKWREQLYRAAFFKIFKIPTITFITYGALEICSLLVSISLKRAQSNLLSYASASIIFGTCLFASHCISYFSMRMIWNHETSDLDDRKDYSKKDELGNFVCFKSCSIILYLIGYLIFSFFFHAFGSCFFRITPSKMLIAASSLIFLIYSLYFMVSRSWHLFQYRLWSEEQSLSKIIFSRPLFASPQYTRFFLFFCFYFINVVALNGMKSYGLFMLPLKTFTPIYSSPFLNNFFCFLLFLLRQHLFLDRYVQEYKNYQTR